MPELPEVETIRRDLEKKILNKKIVQAQVLDKKVASGQELAGVLKNNSFVRLERRGKLLAFALKSGQYLLVHLKMTGQLVYKLKIKYQKSKMIYGGHQISSSDLLVPNKFTRVIFTFSDGSQLFFNDLRRFGYMKIVTKAEKEKIWEKDFGIEPLTKEFKFEKFKELFAKRQVKIKAFLLNQKIVAGIGNIYADEICFCARILPWRKVSGLKKEEIKKLFLCSNSVLKRALKNRGTTFKDFVDGVGKSGKHLNFLNVYGRTGEKCRRCGKIIKKTKHAGRGTHYCPGCQK